MTNPVIESVLNSLGHSLAASVAARPTIPGDLIRQPGPSDSEIDLFLAEINNLSGKGRRLVRYAVFDALNELIAAENINRAAIWDSPFLADLGIAEHLRKNGLELISPIADKHKLASCDLGITTADALLPETGTLVLRSSRTKSRSISLLPRIHLAIVTPEMLRADLHHVLAEGKDSNYLVFITGPSRTADIELTVTLGVHGPQELLVWMLTG
jgi:L-lactate dehydrogenase complex protein LldG